MLSKVVGIIALALALGMLAFAQQAHAADYTAGSLDVQASSSTSAKGNIAPGTKVVKTFKMPKKGYVTFSVKVPKGVGTTAVRIDANDIRYASDIVLNGGTPGGSGKYASSRFSFAPGTKIRVTIEYNSIGNQAVPYSITMNKKTPKYYEAESNRNKTKATAIEAGHAYGGNIMKKDVDWFVFKAPKAGTYSFRGKMALKTSATLSTANMALYQGSKALANKTVTAGNGYESLKSVKLAKGAKVYVKVTPVTVANNSVIEGASENYALKVSKAK